MADIDLKKLLKNCLNDKALSTDITDLDNNLKNLSIMKKRDYLKNIVKEVELTTEIDLLFDSIDTTSKEYRNVQAYGLTDIQKYFINIQGTGILADITQFQAHFNFLVKILRDCGVKDILSTTPATNSMSIEKPTETTPTISKNNNKQMLILRALKVAGNSRLLNLSKTSNFNVLELFENSISRTRKASDTPTRNKTSRVATKIENQEILRSYMNEDNQILSNIMGGTSLETSDIKGDGSEKDPYLSYVNNGKENIFEYVFTKDTSNSPGTDNSWKIASFALADYANDNIKGEDRELLILQTAIICGKTAKQASTNDLPVLFATVNGENADDNIVKAYYLIFNHLIPVFENEKILKNFNEKLQNLKIAKKNNPQSFSPEKQRLLNMALGVKEFKDLVHGDTIYEPKTKIAVDRKIIATAVGEFIKDEYEHFQDEPGIDPEAKNFVQDLLGNAATNIDLINNSNDITPQLYYKDTGGKQIATTINSETIETTRSLPRTKNRS